MTQTLDYGRPELCEHRGRIAVLRIGAAVAAGSAVAAPEFVSLLGWGMQGYLGMGYFIAAGLMCRVLGARSEGWRRAIWGAAMTVHALWAFVIASNLTHGNPPHSARYFLIWWGAVALLCLVGLVLEPRLPAAK
jgi:peptidoglycan/LPS O-acetylase OafA/YrhL